LTASEYFPSLINRSPLDNARAPAGAHPVQLPISIAPTKIIRKICARFFVVSNGKGGNIRRSACQETPCFRGEKTIFSIDSLLAALA
jgi:hypothetical protein